ncbi:MAG: hypothetical protein ABFS56_25025 [Pseudomonadota bacterium]
MILWYTMLNTPWVGALNMHGIVICKRRFWSIAMTCAAMLSEMSCKCKIIAISDEFDDQEGKNMLSNLILILLIKINIYQYLSIQ